MDAMERVVESFVQLFAGKKIFAFHGEMGAGKTTFIHRLCEYWCVDGAVGSPTYSIINEYRCPAGKIFHIDLYRLIDEQEAVRAGVEDCLDSGTVCLVEWAERAPSIFPPETVHIFLELIDPYTRRMSSWSGA